MVLPGLPTKAILDCMSLIWSRDGWFTKMKTSSHQCKRNICVRIVAAVIWRSEREPSQPKRILNIPLAQILGRCCRRSIGGRTKVAKRQRCRSVGTKGKHFMTQKKQKDKKKNVRTTCFARFAVSWMPHKLDKENLWQEKKCERDFAM